MDKKKFFVLVLQVLPVLILILSTFFRFVKLGYSEFQGDEIEAQSYIFYDGSFKDYLLSRSKGPGQFIVTYLTHLKDLKYIELITRLPFAIAGASALIFLYLLAKELFGKRVAFVTLLFAGFSGLLIAFARIAQYQSVVLLFSCVAFYLVYLYFKRWNSNTIILCGLISGISFLFHYDSLAFIFPLIMCLVLTKNYKGLLYFLIPFILTSSVFYIPFVLNSDFKDSANYLWFNRINSETASSTQTPLLLYIYHSKEFLALVTFGIILWLYEKYKNLYANGKVLLVSAVILVILKFYGFSQVNLLSELMFFAFSTYYLYFLSKNKWETRYIIDIWFLLSFFFYALVIKFPLTHIYNFLLPTFILSAYSLVTYLGKYHKVFAIILIIFTISALSFNYEAFINTAEEYPWQKKQYIFGSMYTDIAKGKGVKGVFGFPYNRGWKIIREDLSKIAQEKNIRTYSTNEKTTIANFYLNYDSKNFDLKEEWPDVYIFIKRPQSLINTIKVSGIPIEKKEDFSLYIKDTYKIHF